MNKKIHSRLLREAKNIIILAVLAAALGYLAYIYIADVARRTAADVIRTEWVKAARQANVPSSVIPGGDAESITSKH